MRKKLLVSTAALLAGIAMASAQEMPGGKSGGAQSGAQSERGSAGASHDQGHAGQAQRGAQDQSKQGQSQQRSQGQGKHEQTTGQAQQDQSKQGQSQQRSQAQGKRDQSTGQAQQGQREQSKQGQQGQAQQAPQQGQAKQGQREQGKQGQAHERNQERRDQTTGQAPQRQQGQQGQQAPQQSQAPQQGQAQQSHAQTGGVAATGQAGGSVNLTEQQRTRLQQTVLASSNVPRVNVNNVSFALSVGTAVPTSVRVVDVIPALIEINPAWRGHEYFVVQDDIVIVDRSRKIVAVVPVKSSGAELRGGGAGELSLSADQIRQVQITLKERGFNVEVDGVMGRRTMEAITAFQRQQGFQVSGRIDNQTITALGLSNMTGAQGGPTTGRGGAAAGQGGASQQQVPAQQNQGANQPSTGGQGGASRQQAPAQQDQGANQPSTGGQGGASRQQAPAQQDQAAGQGQENGGNK